VVTAHDPAGRGGGDDGMPPAAAGALARANEALDLGRFAEAAAAFDETAEHELAAGRRTEAAHALRFAASSWRLGGRPELASGRAASAAELVEPGSPPYVAALVERGEALAATGEASEAADAYTRALEDGRAAGMPPAAEALLLHRRAGLSVALGKAAEAAADVHAARRLHERIGDPKAALSAYVDEVTYLQAGGDPARSARIAGAARRAAERAGDHHALADLDLLAATRALNRGDARAALTAARAARAQALFATDPIRYIGAALAVADLAETTGDRVAAYESLAVGLVTVGDVLGRDVARQVFEPPLLAQRDRWGPNGFAAAKRTYEDRRRAALGRA
jgi:hypothetical protein